MSDRQDVFVFGASGHGKVVIDAIERAGAHRVVFVCDDAKEKHGTQIMGYTIIGGRDALLARRDGPRTGIVGIGDNAIRTKLADWLVQQGYGLAAVVHPHAAVGRDVEIGDGTVVMAGCVINTGARLGRNVILNTGATVDHDCEVEDGVHIAPGSHLCGHVSVGAMTLIGAGTTIIPAVRVGRGVVIGAGSTVLGDIPEGARVGGSPCRPLVS
ncbi:MAG TPA: acetyltransferase [Burkholderiales bacterium]|jgi:sugar O-acyltransferase (sialic acid O-acetyltransferase NeuD family)|nr:acetyltransferase [Burkholderiales bacterium]